MCATVSRDSVHRADVTAQPRGGVRRLDAGVARADDDDVERHAIP